RLSPRLLFLVHHNYPLPERNRGASDIALAELAVIQTWTVIMFESERFPESRHGLAPLSGAKGFHGVGKNSNGLPLDRIRFLECAENFKNVNGLVFSFQPKCPHISGQKILQVLDNHSGSQDA